VGLAVTQSVGLIGMIQWGMRQSAELENNMTSLERVLEYTSLESEPPLKSPPGKYVDKNDPTEGSDCGLFYFFLPSQTG
jgi:ATP-binding cassette subfamily C (CFTR/MRP) protein 4